MKKINLAITGCMGRMGQQLIKSANKNKSFKIVSLTENKIINKKISGISPELNTIRAFKKAKIIIDFTVPKCTLEVLKIAVKQKKKVVIAMSLINDPKILLLDEPFAGIDPIAIEDIKNILTSLSKKGISILITDHNIRETITLCKKSIIINNGEILAEGSANELIHNEKVKVHYFGEMFDKP